MPRPRLGHERHVIVMVELLAWWAVAVGVWMASLSAYSSQDLVVAMGCAVPCAAAAVTARRAVGGRWRAPTEALVWVLLLPRDIVAGAARTLSLPLRRRGGVGFRTVRLGPSGPSAVAAGHRAVATVLMSSPPSSYVVRVDEDEGTALVHAVGPPSALERKVAR